MAQREEGISVFGNFYITSRYCLCAANFTPTPVSRVQGRL